MPKMVTQLNDTQIKNAKPKEKDYQLSDGQGLFLLVKTSSAKWWRFNYVSPNDGKRKLLSLGTYPEISLAKARARRDEARQKIAVGIDPSDERQQIKQSKKEEQEKTETTFQSVVDEFFASRKKIWSDSNYHKNYSALRRDILPVFADRAMNEITKQEFLQAIKKIEQRGATRASRDTFNLCGQIWRYAVTHDKVEHNIVGDIDRQSALQPHKTTHFRTITDTRRVGQLLHAIDEYDGSYIVKCALRLAPMLFLRPSELGGLMWEEVNMEASELRIKPERMKMRQLHIVPLAKQAKAILKDIQTLTGDGIFAFPSRISTIKPISENTLNQALKRIDFGDEIVAHGFRAMASTLLNEQKGTHGFNSDVIERQLAHGERNSVRASYNHAEYLAERKKLMQWWADYLDELASLSV